MAGVRDPGWPGFFNARDLGGLPTATGSVTVPGRAFRSADLRFVGVEGWRAAYNAGVRTVIDLRNDDEVCGDGAALGSARFAGSARRPTGPSGTEDIDRVRVPIDDVDDIEMWSHFHAEELDGCPLYYRPFLQRKPERCAAVMTQLARARPGGVLFHCGAGRDRTGLVAVLLLDLAGVVTDAIVEDYLASHADLPALFEALGRPDDNPQIHRALQAKGTTAADALRNVLDGFDAGQYLAAAGMPAGDLHALRQRMLS